MHAATAILVLTLWEGKSLLVSPRPGCSQLLRRQEWTGSLHHNSSLHMPRFSSSFHKQCRSSAILLTARKTPSRPRAVLGCAAPRVARGPPVPLLLPRRVFVRLASALACTGCLLTVAACIIHSLSTSHQPPLPSLRSPHAQSVCCRHASQCRAASARVTRVRLGHLRPAEARWMRPHQAPRSAAPCASAGRGRSLP
jgi:hypothetical protein